jgi:hypothetical protein
MPISNAQGLENLSEQQAIQQLQSNQAYQNIGALTPYRDDRYGANSEGNGAVKTADGQELIAIGDGSYGIPLSPKITVNGRRGAYVGRYDGQGKLIRAEFQPEGTGLLDRYGWLAPLVPVGAAVIAQVAPSLTGSLGPSELASADTGMLGFGGAGPVTPTVESIATAAQAGATPASLASQITNLVRTAGPGVLQALKSIPGLSGIVDQVANTLTGSNGLSTLANIGAGTAMLTGLKDASNTAAAGYSDLGDSLKGQYQFLGDKAQGMFGALGSQGKAGYEDLGMKVGDTYNNLANQTEGRYADLAARTKADVGKFTPYNITTNVGSTDATGKFTPTAGSLGPSGSATGAATSSFGAANGIDVNNLAKQRYDLMQSIFAPGDAQNLAAIQAQQQARGRTGLQSLNPATTMDSVGSNPAMVAYYKAVQDRNLKAQATAADQALAQRGGLLSQGTQAAGVPLQIAQAGTNQLQLGGSLGNTAFNASMAGAQLGSGIEQRGLDQGTGFRGTGVGAVTGLFQQGLNYGLGAQEKGINKNLDYSVQGIDASTPQYVRSIGQRYEGNRAATNALFSLLSAIARGTGQTTPASTGSASQAVGQIAQMLRGAGVSDADIQRIIQSQVAQGDPFTSNDYQDNIDTVNSIWDKD